MRLPFHPLANIFPMMTAEEHADLVADMRASGYRAGEEIVMLDGAILDGRNRYLCAIEAGIIPADFNPATDTGEAGWLFSQFSDKGSEGLLTTAEVEAGPLAFVIAKNLKRRHLNESQRASVAEKLANLGHGGDRRSDQAANLRLENEIEVPAVSRADAARLLNVSERSIDSMRTVRMKGTPELVAAVDQGKLAVSLAARATKLDAEQQREVAEGAAAGKANVVRSVIKKGTRASREKALGEKQRALPDKRYGVILADPEWRFEPWSRETGLDRAADNHYSTSTTLDICARPVGNIAAEDCALFMWATAPMLLAALNVLQHWGFEYRSHQVWVKERPGEARGPGYWFTGEHELLLLGVKGSVPAPAEGTQWPSVFIAPVGRHSQKPEIVLEMIEQLFPNLPKIELNRRGPPRPGWDAWGDEVAEGAAQPDPKSGAVCQPLLPHDAETGELLEDHASPAPASSGHPLPQGEREARPASRACDIDLTLPAFLDRRKNPRPAAAQAGEPEPEAA